MYAESEAKSVGKLLEVTQIRSRGIGDWNPRLPGFKDCILTYSVITEYSSMKMGRGFPGGGVTVSKDKEA